MRYVQKSVWPYKKHIWKFNRKFAKRKSFKQNSFQISSGDNHDQRDIASKLCSYSLNGSYFIMQTSKLLFINATAVTLGQGHR